METATNSTVVYDNVHASGGLSASAASWGAIVCGAIAAAAMALILFVLGAGLGLTSVSPWVHDGIDAQTFGIAAITWVVFTSVASSALGGYLAGRLRVRWLEVPRDEVYFRDTAHGFLAWALAALFTAALLGGVMASVASLGARTGISAASALGGGAVGVVALGAASAEDSSLNYYLDALFRRDPATASAAAPDARSEAPALSEVSRIVSRAYRRGELAAEDVEYLGRLVARYTGLDQPSAEARVRATYDSLGNELRELETAAREAADQARAASAQVTLWGFVALLAGAFAGSYAATWGGRQRDL
jgi:hypothetical protein